MCVRCFGCVGLARVNTLKLKLDLRGLRCIASTVDFRQRGSFPATAAAAAPAPAAPSGALLGHLGFHAGTLGAGHEAHVSHERREWAESG